MITRRRFLQYGVSAGAALWGGAALTGCAGVTRRDLPLHAVPAVSMSPAALTILRQASLAPSGHNTQPWRVRLESRDRWVVEADARRRLPIVDPHNRELLLSIGAFVENLTLSAGIVGFGSETRVIAGRPDSRDLVRIAFHQGRPSGYPASRLKTRRTVKNGLQPRELTAAHVKFLARQAGGRLFYFPRKSSHAACIRDAAVEAFRAQTSRDAAQRELVQWLRLSAAAAKRHRDGLTTEGMEITGTKGWLLRQLCRPEDFLKPSLRRQSVAATAALAGQGAGWLLITSPGSSPADLIATGRRFEKMALTARELGIGIHPMTQVLEEPSGLSLIAGHHCEAILPQFVLRVGYVDPYPEPVSLRRPPAWFAYA